MAAARFWEEIGMAVTVTDAAGIIVAMNVASRQAFAREGGEALLGSSVFACHPEPARSQLEEMFARRVAHHYTVSKGGQQKIVHQLPWYRGGEFAGFVELSIPIPDTLPHVDRG